jgi:N-acetylglucosamine-6-phosphate deacetylase
MNTSFVDIQLNGYNGVDFSSPHQTVEDIEWVIQQQRRQGTSAFCPTVVTTTMENYKQILPVLAKACKNYPESLLGIHLEGPFISPEDGAVGAHPKQCVLPPSIAVFDQLQNWADGYVRILTLAPEQQGALDLIRHASSRGICIGIGHTLADETAINAAVAAGADLSIHLGNGCPQKMHRHENPVVAQLGCPLPAAIISDGHHLPPSFIRMVLAAKGIQRTIVVSDATCLAGQPPGTYEIFGGQVQLEENGRIRNLEAPGLAGSSATMLECMRHLAQTVPLTEKDLIAIGRENPLRLLGLSSERIHPLNNVHIENNRLMLSEEPLL